MGDGGLCILGRQPVPDDTKRVFLSILEDVCHTELKGDLPGKRSSLRIVVPRTKRLGFHINASLMSLHGAS